MRFHIHSPTVQGRPLQQMDITTDLFLSGTSFYGPMTPAFQYVQSGQFWKRVRGNESIVLLPLASRSATTSSAEQENISARGALFILHVTAVPGVDTIQLQLDSYEQESGTAIRLMPFPAVSATGYYRYLIYPGASNAGTDIVQAGSFPLPRRWRVSVIHSGTGAFTYRVSAHLII